MVFGLNVKIDIITIHFSNYLIRAWSSILQSRTEKMYKNEAIAKICIWFHCFTCVIKSAVCPQNKTQSIKMIVDYFWHLVHHTLCITKISSSTLILMKSNGDLCLGKFMNIHLHSASINLLDLYFVFSSSRILKR